MNLNQLSALSSGEGPSPAKHIKKAEGGMEGGERRQRDDCEGESEDAEGRAVGGRERGRVGGRKKGKIEESGRGEGEGR